MKETSTAADAKRRLEMRLAMAEGDWTDIDMSDAELGLVTELDFPRLDDCSDSLSRSEGGGKFFLKMNRLRRVFVPKGDYSLGYFQNLSADSLSVEWGAMRFGLFRNSRIGQLTILPSSLDRTGNGSLLVDSSVREVRFHDSILRIPEKLFMDTDVQSVFLPEGLERVEREAFYGSNVREVAFPERARLDYHSFKNTKLLKDADLRQCECCQGAFAGSGVERVSVNCGEIEQAAFEECSRLKRLEIGPNVRHIKYGAFMRSGLETVSIPENVELIGDSAFYFSKSLKTVHFSRNVNGGGLTPSERKRSGKSSGILYQCENLKQLYVDFPVADVQAMLDKLGLDENQAGSYDGNRPGSVRVECPNTYSESRTRMAKIGGLLAQAGVQSHCSGNFKLVAEFGKGMTFEISETVQRLIQEFCRGGEYMQISFHGADGGPLGEISDLSQIKMIIFQFPDDI